MLAIPASVLKDAPYLKVIIDGIFKYVGVWFLSQIVKLWEQCETPSLYLVCLNRDAITDLKREQADWPIKPCGLKREGKWKIMTAIVHMVKMNIIMYFSTSHWNMIHLALISWNLYSIIIWQRFCENARLRIAYCLCVIPYRTALYETSCWNRCINVVQSFYSLPQKKVYTFVEPSTENWGGLHEK